MTIKDPDASLKYSYYVYNWSRSPSITVSEARVRVYIDNELVKTYTVPTSGSGLSWHVCDIVDGDTLVDGSGIQSETPYATGRGGTTGGTSSGSGSGSASGAGSSGTGTSSVGTTYTASVATTTNGMVAVNPERATAGNAVTISVTPTDGYELDTLTVKDTNNNPVSVTNNTFTMPSGNVTITATFKALPSYTVTFDTDGGSSVSSQAVRSGKTASKPTNPTRGGYTFIGWYTDNAHTTAYNFSSVVTANITLYAKWILATIPTYTAAVGVVTHGTVTVNPETAEAGDTVTVSVEADDGYELDTLTVTDSSSNEVTVTDDTFVMPSGNVTITATFKELPSYTISFDTNGGSTISSQTVKSGKTVTKPTDPTKSNYTFGGWYTDSGCTTAFDFSTIVTKNITLYAEWISAIAADMVYVPGMTITGSTSATDSKVFRSGRSITIGNITACDHPVTQGEYETYCTYGASSPSDTDGKGANYPAYYVSWYDALVYCNKRSIAEGLTPCYTIGGSTNPASWPGVVDDGAGKHCGPASSNADWYAATCNVNALVYCNLRSMAEGLTPVYTIGGSTNPADWTNVVSSGTKYCGPSYRDATWDAATQDMTADGYRLPTEAEWEWLARGGDPDAAAWSYTYAGSDTIGDVAWYSENSGSTTHEVRGKAANSLGLYDMSGNVWEWCWDWYGTITASTPAAGAASGSSRVLRGGSWSFNADGCTVSHRDSGSPFVRYYDLGFRVVRSSSE